MGTVREPRPTILLIEDDADIGALIAEFLQGEGYRVTRADSAAAGLAALARGRFALVLTDGFVNQATDASRWTVVEQVRRAAHDTPVIICTAHTARDFAGATERGFAALLSKPFDLDDLLALIGRLIAPAAPETMPPDHREPERARARHTDTPRGRERP